MSTAPTPDDDGTDAELPAADDPGEDTPGEVGEPARPDLKSSSFGILGKFFKYCRFRSKLRRKAGNGYVLWYLLDDSFPEPRFVKPEREGAGVPELKHEGTRYLFPPEGRLPHRRNGMWVYVHSKEDSVPINLSHPSELALDPGVLQQYSELKPETDSPSWFNGLDVEPQELFIYLIFGIGLLATIVHLAGAI